MRATEFITESGNTGYYTIGDSHAVSVARMGGRGWTNLAIGGRSSTSPDLLANINHVPRGAIVLVCVGANDTANAMLSHNQGRPLKSPEVIARNVANTVNLVQAQGATVIFLLFPNGPARGGKGAQYYGGPYQDKVRNAIRSALSVPIIDLNGKPLTDGIHATMGTYKDVADQVRQKYNPSGSKQSAVSSAPKQTVFSNKPKQPVASDRPKNKNPERVGIVANVIDAVKNKIRSFENFADGRNPQDKGDSKRHGVPTKASVSTLRKVAKQGGRKGQLAHWMANMKAGRAKKK